MMVSEGMAVVYEAGGGEYGPWGKKGLQDIEKQAKYVTSSQSGKRYLTLF